MPRPRPRGRRNPAEPKQEMLAIAALEKRFDRMLTQQGEKRAGVKKPTSTGECFDCGRRGHFARDCREVKKSTARRPPSQQPSAPRRERSTACFNCGGEGHFARDCRRGNQQQQQPQQPRGPPPQWRDDRRQDARPRNQVAAAHNESAGNYHGGQVW